MPNETLGASFQIDTTNLKAGLAQANRMIRESESEFKAAAAGMDDWSSSAEGVTARIQHLNTTTDLQRKKVDALKSEYNRLIKDGLDPTSKQASDLRIKINNETTALNKNEKELEQQTRALEEMGNETEEAAKDTDKLADSAGKSGKGLSALKGAAALGAAAIAAVAAAAVAGIAKLLSLAESTRELRNEMARLETGFTSNGLAAEDATKTYQTLYSVLGDTGRASEAAGHLALLANNTKDLEKWTNIATGVYAQFGDSLPIEGLTEAANETAKVGDLTGVLADALNWAGVNEDDFQDKLDACSTEQERQKLITETLNGLYSEQAEKFKELNKDVIAAREAEAELAQAQADLGATVEPLTTKITEFKTKLLTEFSPALKQIVEDMVGVANGTEGATEKLSESINNLISDVLQKFVDFLPQAAEMATELMLLIVQTIIEQLPAIMQAGIEILTTLITSIADMLPTLIPTIVDAVVLMAETLIDNIDMIIDAGIKLIQGLADGLIEAIPRLLDKVPTIIEKLFNALIDNLPKLLDAGVKFIIELSNGLIKAIPDLLAKLPTIIAQIVKGLLTEGIPALLSAGGQLLAGLFEGMLNPSVIWENIKKIGGGIIDGFKSFFGIKSPSRLFRDEIGSFMGEGLALGIGDGFDDRIKGVNKAIVRSMSGIGINTQAGTENGAQGRTGAQSGVVVNQYNTFAQAHSRYELYKAKQQTAAAVRLATAGGV